MKDKRLTIGALASAANVNIETIRYYQRVKLITEPAKPPQGFRVYPEETLKRVKFIKRAQQLGFSLKEIDELLQLGKGHCKDVRQLAETKYEQVDQQIKDLQKLKTTLTKLITSCEAGTEEHCAIVETLSQN